jgi:hypothetical protein
MTTKFVCNGTLAFAAALLSTGMAYAAKPSWCANGVLLETRSYSDGGQARDYANSQSGSATINGAAHVVIGTVDVVKAPAGNLVYVVQVWNCPKTPPPDGGGRNGGNTADKEKVTYTLDPHPELDRNGKKK